MDNKKALIIIDVQNDFLPGGSLAVPGGDEIIPLISDLAEGYDIIVITQDFHPAGHKSFASTHGAEPFTMTQMPYGEQVLWPDHCVQGTDGAKLALPKNLIAEADFIVQKGRNPEIDSYSAFMENDGVTSTGLGDRLREMGVTDIDLCGLAYDYCVAFSALDGVREGFKTTVLRSATREIASETARSQTEAMKDAGVLIKDSA